MTVEQYGKYNIIIRNAAGATGNHSYSLSFYHVLNPCIQFVFSSIYEYIYESMYLCIYVSISLPNYTFYSWTGCWRCLGAIPSAAEYDYPVNSEIQMDSMIE
jgi:hypothetical protein